MPKYFALRNSQKGKSRKAESSKHFLLKFINNHSKLETIFLLLAIITSFAGLIIYIFVHSIQLDFYQTIKKADTLVALNNFDEATDIYKNTFKIFPIENQIINDHLNYLQLQQNSSKNFHKGLDLLSEENYTESIAYLSLVDKTSDNYNEAQDEITNIQNIIKQETAIKSEFYSLQILAETNELHSNFKEAIQNLTKAYQIGQSNKFLNIDKTTLDLIEEHIVQLQAQENKKEEYLSIPVGYTLKVPILMYHYIRTVNPKIDSVGYGLSVRTEDFENQMKYLYDNSFTTITMMDLINGLKNKSTLPKKPIILTFDDGYLDFYTTAYPILKKYNLKAESYIITNFVGHMNYMTWEMIKELSESNIITIGSHTLNHPNLSALGAKSVDTELVESKKILESHLGIKITDFCYPYGLYNTTTQIEAKKAGYLNATTTNYGFLHSDTNFYNMTRIRVVGGETLTTFINSL